MVYILNKDKQPLMPTNNHGMVRVLLKSKQAKVIKRTPFTIQILTNTTNYTQPITLGIDAGSKKIGLSATTEQQELYSGEVELRNDIVKLLSDRRSLRRSRRSRKTRCRKPRFNNRVSSKQEGWLAPSILHKVNSHLTAISDLHKLLPITNIRIEVAAFDIQKIQNPKITGSKYQKGEMSDFDANVREYVLYRDRHLCRCCKGKSKDPVLQVHHIESRKTGGNAPNNLITLCKHCHDNYHRGIIELPKSIKRGVKFNDTIFMGIMRWALYHKLKEKYPNVEMTFGYITKAKRIEQKLPKEHYVDAFVITDNLNAKLLDCYYYTKLVRNHNRQLYKLKIAKGGYRKNNQAPKYVCGFKLFDKVKYLNHEYFVFGRRVRGYFSIRDLNNTNLGDISFKKLKLISRNNAKLTERRSKEIAIHLTT